MEKEDEEINPQDSAMKKEEEAAGCNGGHYCKECNKSFNSGKALGGHMSSAHVQDSRRQRPRAEGANPCPLCDKTFPSKKSLFGHMRCHPNRGYRGMEPPPQPYIFQDWPSTSKRGRGYVPERETFDAGHQLLKLIKTSPQRDEIKGKEKDALDELYTTAIQVLMGMDSSLEKTSMPSDESGSYMCNVCEKGFDTHQALGGHRSSHNKFKLSIINTADRKQPPKVNLGFDLNMTPEDEDHDVNGDHS